MKPGRTTWHLLGLLSATLVGGVALYLKGPLPVVVVSYATPHVAPFSYMISAFPFFGALCGELAWRWLDHRGGGFLALQILALGLLAVGRLALQIPVSGHVVLQVFFCGFSWRSMPEPYRLPWTATGALGLAYLLYTKLIAWSDFVTPTTATILALLVLAVKERSPRTV
jgi:hypothetical protein